jgi:hypothetical protein
MKIRSIFFYEVRKTGLRLPSQTPERRLEFMRNSLEYDGMFVNPENPDIVALVVFKTPYGLTRQDPTFKRWESFNYLLVHIPEREHELRAEMDSAKWVTFVHPRAPNGSVDYSDLEPVPLERFILARNYRDIHDVTLSL